MKESKIKKLTVKDIAFIGVATAAAMMLAYIESFFSLGIPGLKVGLPNIFIIVVLYRFDVLRAGAVSLIRAVLTALLFGSVMSLWYSLAGGLLSLVVMWLLKKTDKFSPVGVSVAGGVCHNIGQIAVAIAVTGVEEIAYYLPVLIIGGTVAGVLIGLVSSYAVKVTAKIKL